MAQDWLSVHLINSMDQAREYKLAVAKGARQREEQTHSQFNHIVRQGANLAQSRVEKGFNRTSKQKRYRWYPRRRIWFWFAF